ncbi:MAG: serine/threonine protein kinase [Myxococcales bacterium]|nr:serine/threonine protein kinase [Myxococcales bacterium]
MQLVYLRPGFRFGSYTLTRRVAMGGMAEIWAAQGEEDEFALKFMQPHHQEDPEYLKMFEDELQLARRLRHENIVATFDGFRVKGKYAQVMELVHGVDLRRIKIYTCDTCGSMPLPLLLRLGVSVSRALAYVHTRRSYRGRDLGIVHRDISPHNIMLDKMGRVKILDFGIAKASQRKSRTQTGMIKGKVGYMSPEQTMGHILDHRSDIFSLGIVLWEVLSGEPLFRGDSDLAIMRKVQQAEVPRLDASHRRPDLPLAVVLLVHQMLNQSPEHRPANMIEVERRLGRVMMQEYEPSEYSEGALAQWIEPMMKGAQKKPTLSLEQ